jgi:hypothetical protein
MCAKVAGEWLKLAIRERLLVLPDFEKEARTMSSERIFRVRLRLSSLKRTLIPAVKRAIIPITYLLPGVPRQIYASPLNEQYPCWANRIPFLPPDDNCPITYLFSPRHYLAYVAAKLCTTLASSCCPRPALLRRLPGGTEPHAFPTAGRESRQARRNPQA